MLHKGRRRPGRGRRRHWLRDNYAYVLDYMRFGNPSDRHPWHRNKPVAQLIGEDYFTLMEATPRPGAELEVGERVYVGPVHEERLKIEKIDTRIDYEDLTTIARDMLPQILTEIVKKKEPVFVMFFNIAQPITLRFHSLELLPGVGKKTLHRILEYREKKPFESFEEIKEVAHIDPVKTITERIIEELKGGQRYYLFVHPPPREMEQPVPPRFLNYLEAIYRELRRRARQGEGDGGGQAQA